MINYERCTPNDIDDMFEAFTKGFSDYIVKFDLTKERFIELFLNIEGNSIEYSYIARDGSTPIGLMLGGIKTYEGVKTLRCGTLAIDPLYRKQGIAQELYNRHYAIGIEEGCQQLFLEVIKGNDKAIRFYLKQGYDIKYDIFYYQKKDVSSLKDIASPNLQIKEIGYDQAKAFYLARDRSHINWQNDFDYQSHFKNILYLGAYQEGLLVGVLALTQIGKIFYLYVIKSYRLKGIGKQLLSDAVKLHNIPSLHLSMTNNDALRAFLEKLGFELQPLSQHEMYLPL